MLAKAILFAPGGEQELALAPVANRPLVLHAIDWLADSGISHVVVAPDPSVAGRVRELVDAAAPSWLRVSWTESRDAGDFRRALAAAEDLIAGEPFLVHLGDCVSRAAPPWPATRARSADDALVLVQAHPRAGDARVIPLRPGVFQPPPGLATAGVYVFRSAIDALLARASAEESDASPDWGLEPQIAASLGSLERRGGRVRSVVVADWWRYRQQPEDLLQGNRFALEGLEPALAGAELVDTRIEGAAVIHPSARLTSTIVRGPAIIGPGARLADAYIGPYTSIGPHVVVEGAEIEYSIILRDASIRYVHGRIEESIVGPAARVFRDFRLPKAVRLNVGKGAEVALD